MSVKFENKLIEFILQ